ncbi:Siphovirus Gp157 [uncultured Caudovirales phage]|uniref:Siphovirus Gp157 n=1 Tax=uncultured Caudovirales phage TaxID=2100421 RepID=A0A6J5NAK6_9CAUD|nr:Siphovirus Gp157 [uncultured Caudovirales phage]
MENSSSLRELVQSSQSIVEALIESNGELSPEMELQLQNLEVALPAKIDSYSFILEKLEAEEEFWKAKAKQLTAVAKGCSNVRDRIKESLKQAAVQLGKDELVGNDVRFKISNSKPKLVIDESQVDEAYKIIVTTKEIDKKRIEEDLKLNVPVQGASLVETKSIRSYINKGLK